MKALIAKCGCNCSNCPSYKENLVTFENRIQCSLGWEKYFNIKLKPEKIRACDGCAIPDKKRKVYYLNCRVRKCAVFNGVKNCAYCSGYPCQDVRTIHSVQKPDARESIEQRIGYIIPQSDYLSIVEPYEGITHLDEIRASLKPEDIVSMIPVSKTPRITPFPENIYYSTGEKYVYHQLHQIISSIEVSKNVSYARHIEQVKNRKQTLKLLWTFGLLAEFAKGMDYLILSSENYSSQKITSYYSKVQQYIKILGTKGIVCEIIPINDKTWKTRTDALRREGWYLRIYAKKNSNKELFKALKNYTRRLDQQYGESAFTHFVKADMRVLG